MAPSECHVHPHGSEGRVLCLESHTVPCIMTTYLRVVVLTLELHGWRGEEARFPKEGTIHTYEAKHTVTLFHRNQGRGLPYRVGSHLSSPSQIPIRKCQQPGKTLTSPVHPERARETWDLGSRFLSSELSFPFTTSVIFHGSDTTL